MARAETINEVQSEEQKNLMRIGAFIGWQTKETDKNFGEYLKYFGLGDPGDTMSKENKKYLAEKAYAKVDKIKELIRKKHG